MSDDLIVEKLKAYIKDYGDSILMAGPPSLRGSLAHFYKTNQDIADQIKNFQVDGKRPGIHSFVHAHSGTLSITGPRNCKEIVLQQSLRQELVVLKASIQNIQSILKNLSDQVDDLIERS